MPMPSQFVGRQSVGKCMSCFCKRILMDRPLHGQLPLGLLAFSAVAIALKQGIGLGSRKTATGMNDRRMCQRDHSEAGQVHWIESNRRLRVRCDLWGPAGLSGTISPEPAAQVKRHGLHR